MPRLSSWLKGVFRRRRLEREMADEMAFHLQARTDHWIAQGLSPAEAARRARLEFGAVDRYKDDCRQARGLRWLDELRGDVGYTLRMLRAAPVFTAVAVSMLAIGIGANTAVFSVVEAVMLRMLPVSRPEALRELAWIEPHDRPWRRIYDGSMWPFEDGTRIAMSFALPVYAGMRDRSTAFSALFAFSAVDVNLDTGGRAEQAPGLLVSGTFFTGLGATPLLGRGIEPADDRADAPAVAVVSYRLWQRAFAGDARALGRTIRVNGTPMTVVGVLPASLDAIDPGRPLDVLLPLAPGWAAIDGNPARLADGHYWGFRVMGRLRDGVDDGRALAETEAHMRQSLAPDILAAGEAGLPRLVIRPGGQGLDFLRHTYARPLYLLLAIMAAVLLIACANVAGLLLTRAAGRAREIDMRLALGAGRARLVRQLLTESVVLAAIGAAIGIGLAFVVRGSLLPALNQDQAPIELPLGVSSRVLAFSIGLSLAVGLACGVLPALRATRRRLVVARSIGAAGAPRAFTGKALIALQVAMSLVLLVGAGLFTRTLANLQAQALGFRPDHLLLFHLDGTTAGYEDARLFDFYAQVLERVAATPGVQSAAFSRHGLVTGGATRDNIRVPGAPAGHDQIRVYVHFVSPGYFGTMGIPLLAGRDLGPGDREEAPQVLIVNQALARQLGGGPSPIGRQVVFEEPAPVEIVGLVADARFDSLRAQAPPTIYVPYRQHRQHRMTFAARLAGEPAGVLASVRAAVAAIDPNVPLYDVQTQEMQLDTATRQERVFAYVSSGFAILAVILACLGIYGTLAYGVARRAAEIGLRMALGASRGEVVALVLREAVLPVAWGTAIGLGLALATTRFVQSILFDVPARDPGTLAWTTLALIAVALLAAWIPSRRAASVDPVTALRCE